MPNTSQRQRSVRSIVVDRRTYHRPLNKEGTQFESESEMYNRCINTHGERLWSEAGGTPDLNELRELHELAASRLVSPAGRTRWLGGTELAFSRACSQFNCAGTPLHTVYDVVDGSWLLLNGSGVSGLPQPGILHGFNKRIPTIKTLLQDNSPSFRGRPSNVETYETIDGLTRRTISIGDSAEAWAKAIGKLFSPDARPCDELLLDFTECRGPGERLSGYGWICHGPAPLAKAMGAISDLLNRRSGDLLNSVDITDVFNHIGTVLSTRRSAELVALPYHSPDRDSFAAAKIGCYSNGNEQRGQSNNSFIFWSKPSLSCLKDLLLSNLRGSDIGFINGEAALRRAPWFRIVNPCAEILLGAFCNLFEINLPAFAGDPSGLLRASYLCGRANFRQTCVDLDDGILQPVWDQSNKALRLCGTSLTGIVQSPWLTDYDIRRTRDAAVHGAYSMADELGLPRPKAITTVKPSGTLSKVMDCSEGIHLPLGRYIFNWIGFSKSDPLVPLLTTHGYEVIDHPTDPQGCLIKFPVDMPAPGYTQVGDRLINCESAITQLNRYHRWLHNWADHNVSVTIYYDESEIPDIVSWLDSHWDSFISVSWMQRQSVNTPPSEVKRQLGVPYLPQEVVGLTEFTAYSKNLRTLDFSLLTDNGIHDLLPSPDCSTGACPIR